MTVQLLKEYIYNNNKIEYVLNQIGCGHIVYHPEKEYYSASNYDMHKNKEAINVLNNKYLNCKNYTRQQYFDDKSDLITLVQYNKQYNFIEAIKYLHKLFKLSFSYKKEQPDTQENLAEIDPLYIFKKVKERNFNNVLDINPIDEEQINDYVPYIHIDWYREGIMPWTIKKFGLAYSYKYKRNIIPLRYWLNGELLGFNRRTTVDNYELFDIKKYIITSSYPKRLNLFGLWENKESILQAEYVVVYESEKSVLKRDSLNDSTGVALSGHSISDEQVRILIGLNIEIILALDNDVDINEVRMNCENFYGSRKISYIQDKWSLIPKKSCAADCRNQIFQFLIKYRKIYDENEHKEYLKSIRK